MDRNAAFDIVKEVRIEQGKASRSTEIILGYEKYIQGYDENQVSFERDSGVE